MLNVIEATNSSLDDPALRGEWFAVASSEQLLSGHVLAVKMMGIDVVLWRSATEIHAWRDLCIHRGAKLSLGRVRDECLICPYHGWHYDGEGKCAFIPSQPDRTAPLRARAETFHVRDRYGLIWVSISNPIRDIPDFPAAMDGKFRTFLCGPYSFEAQGPRLIENFLDVGHLPIAHEQLLGDLEHAAIGDYEVFPGTSNGEGPFSGGIDVRQPNPDGTGASALMTYRYKVHAPLVASFTKSFGTSQVAILYAITPVTENSSIGWCVMALNYASEVPVETLRAFQDLIVSQDKAIVESQRPELLPMDLQEELHLRSDRMAIAYRSWLKQINLRYGTA